MYTFFKCINSLIRDKLVVCVWIMKCRLCWISRFGRITLAAALPPCVCVCVCVCVSATAVDYGYDNFHSLAEQEALREMEELVSSLLSMASFLRPTFASPRWHAVLTARPLSHLALACSCCFMPFGEGKEEPRRQFQKLDPSDTHVNMGNNRGNVFACG